MPGMPGAVGTATAAATLPPIDVAAPGQNLPRLVYSPRLSHRRHKEIRRNFFKSNQTQCLLISLTRRASERSERATRPPSREALRRGLAVALAEAETERQLLLAQCQTPRATVGASECVGESEGRSPSDKTRVLRASRCVARPARHGAPAARWRRGQRARAGPRLPRGCADPRARYRTRPP
jgi:hypothetical protein